jgi:uncharacterized protein involved in outer membrane biogenesis
MAWWIGGGLTCALLLGALVLHAIFDQARVIDLARHKVGAALSRDVTIGDLSLRIMPVPALVANHVTVANPSWARNKNLLEAGTITAHLKLLPLLGGQIVVNTVSIEDAKVYPEVSVDGRRSWDFANGPTRSRTAERFNPRRLTMLRVRNAQISYLNGAASAKVWQIDEFSAHAQRGWRNVTIEVMASHDQHMMHAKGEFSDLSRAGIQGAASEGAVKVQWGDAQLTVAGKFPLDQSLQGLAAKADFDARSLTELLGLFGVRSGPIAPIKASADLRGNQGRIAATDLKFSLGNLAVAGHARLSLSGSKFVFDAHLATDRLDWVKTLSDAGRPPVPPKPPGELFRTHALAWPLLAAMEDVEGAAEIRIQNLKLRSGTEVKDVKARMTLKGDHLNIPAFSGNLLGGSASGNAQLEGRKQTIHVNLDASDLSLAQWLAEPGRKTAMSGGPMKIKASISATGGSMKELAASLSGPVDVRVGSAKIYSRKIEQAETLLIGLAPMLSAQDSDEVHLVCAAAKLPFHAGRATAEPIAGARSDASQILTLGFVDLRQQTLDLRGRVKARSGIHLGVSTLAGEVKIVGKIKQPEAGLDPAGTPGILARLGAAIFTSGASLLAESIWDAAGPASDPCQIVFSSKAAQSGKPATEQRKPADQATR